MLFLFVAPAVADEIDDLHKQILYPCARVRTPQGGGSGTLIYCQDRDEDGRFDSFVLTNHHVIASAIRVVDRWHPLLKEQGKVEELETVIVEFFRPGPSGAPADARESYDADIVAYDVAEDLALLRLRSRGQRPQVAQLIPLEQAEGIRIFERVIAVGCSLLHPPIVTSGEIMSLTDEIERRSYWMANAQIIFGNSGGGVYIKRGNRHYLIGVPSRVAVTGGWNVVTHMGYLIPPTRLHKWIRDQHLLFLVAADHTPDGDLAYRKKLQEEAAKRRRNGTTVSQQP